jgi:hypothetical protein
MAGWGWHFFNLVIPFSKFCRSRRLTSKYLINRSRGLVKPWLDMEGNFLLGDFPVNHFAFSTDTGQEPGDEY